TRLAMVQGAAVVPRPRQLDRKAVPIRSGKLPSRRRGLGPRANGASRTGWAAAPLRVLLSGEGAPAGAAPLALDAGRSRPAGSERQGLSQAPGSQPGRASRRGRPGARGACVPARAGAADAAVDGGASTPVRAYLGGSALPSGARSVPLTQRH